jgi:hypothetical protein
MTFGQLMQVKVDMGQLALLQNNFIRDFGTNDI